MSVQLLFLILWLAGFFHGSVTLLIIAIFAGIFLGPVFCGWICPAGTLQELSGKMNKLIIRQLKICSPVLPKKTTYIRYAAAAVIIILWLTGTFTILKDIQVPPIIPWILLTAAITANLIIPRFFCRLLCPMGAINSLTNLIKLFPVKTKKDCTLCGNCERICPVGIYLSKKGNNRDTRCISCFSCIAVCPDKNMVGYLPIKYREKNI